MVATESDGEDSGAREVPWLARGKSERSGKDSGGTLGARWRPRSRQEEGRKSEKEIAKKLGAKLHPNSGALRIKHDASDSETLYEIKDANKTYSLSADELNTLWVRAMRETKEPVFIIKFKHRGMTATITLKKEVNSA